MGHLVEKTRPGRNSAKPKKPWTATPAVERKADVPQVKGLLFARRRNLLLPSSKRICTVVNPGSDPFLLAKTSFSTTGSNVYPLLHTDAGTIGKKKLLMGKKIKHRLADATLLLQHRFPMEEPLTTIFEVCGWSVGRLKTRRIKGNHLHFADET